MQIEIPHKFRYRDYQKPVVSFIRKGGKRAVTKWHRRAGKDKTYWNLTVEMALRELGGYVYILPTYTQGKKIIWDSIDKDGLKFRDHVPPPLMVGENGTELKLNLKNGSFIQVLGSDNIDSLRGISPRGIVFSEFAFQNPTVWEVMRPILAENGGWAIFNSTPNGKNHFYELCQMAERSQETDGEWFYQSLTVDDTGVVSKEYIEQERRNGMSEEMIQQEYYVSFDVGAIGSYYAREIEQARSEGRITQLPFNRDIPVNLYFDLGVNDNFTISFVQKNRMFYDFVNYYENNGKTLEHYFGVIDEWIERKGAKLGRIYLPHDSKQKGHSYLVAGKTIFDKFLEKYPNKIEYIPNKISVNDGIQEGRAMLPKCRFDIDNSSQLVRCLENYTKDYDDTRKVFRDQPYHNWASHGADNFRYFAISANESPSTITLYTRDDGLDNIMKGNMNSTSYESSYFISL